MRPSGRQAQLERFIEDYSERGYQFAYRLSGSAEEAKELVQEGFVRVMEKWDTYDASQPMENWFLTILRNIYMDGMKRYEKRRGVPLDAAIGPSGMTFAEFLHDGHDESLLERLERQRATDEVQRAMDSLSPEHRAILTLCDVQGLTYVKACDVLDAPLGTVRARMNRARNAFRKAMLEHAREVEI